MKKTLLFALVLSMLLIGNSCSKVDDVINTGIIQCKINGNAWKSTPLTTAYIVTSAPNPITSTITAIGTDSKKIVILFSKLIAVGTYSLDIDPNAFAASYIDADNKTYISTSGRVQIKEVDAEGKISGDFYFICTDGVSHIFSITEGLFNKVVKK